jgi:hypothetical protein
MIASTPTWSILLRCCACRGKFTLHRLTRDRVLLVPLVTSCPHCAARPHVAAYDTEESKLHRIIDLRQDKQDKQVNPSAEKPAAVISEKSSPTSV